MWILDVSLFFTYVRLVTKPEKKLIFNHTS